MCWCSSVFVGVSVDDFILADGDFIFWTCGDGIERLYGKGIKSLARERQGWTVLICPEWGEVHFFQSYSDRQLHEP